MSEQKDGVVVPREPTEEMVANAIVELDKLCNLIVTRGYIEDVEIIIAYKAMLSASPSHPQEKDAGRYRWLREQCTPFSDWKVSTVVRVDGERPERVWLHNANLDAAIDRAIKETGETR